MKVCAITSLTLERRIPATSIVLCPRQADTPECWIKEFQLDFIFSCNFGHLIKMSANIHDLYANMTKIVGKCRIYLAGVLDCSFP